LKKEWYEVLTEKELRRAKNGSIAIGVVTKEGRYYDGQFHDDLNETNIKDMIFEIGSTTKTFTSLLLSKMVLEGTISLDDPIVKYKPTYEKSLVNSGKEITFRHLSTHLSGLPREDSKVLRKRMKQDAAAKHNVFKYYTNEDLERFFTDFQLKKEIGKKWGYSNLGVGLLGNVLSEILSESYETAITEHILTPFGMKDTYATVRGENLYRYTASYNVKGERIPQIEIPAVPGAGILKSTLHDMLTYLEYQMGLKETDVSDAISLTHQLHGDTTSKKAKMGLGWFIEKKEWYNEPIIHHSGTTHGFHTYCGFLKEKGIGIVIFSTIQLKLTRLLRIALNLEDNVNENIANAVFKKMIR
jgi:CubicO group peptidase (beta-lactamase class C family)